VRYRAPADAYGAALTATLVEEKDRVDDSTGPYFHTPGFSIFDFTGYWNLNKQAVITAGIFNLLDRKYYLWSDLSRVSLASGSGPIPNGTGLDRYSQPGRNAAVSFKYQF
jgi:hemoglobin/transferrin/lactoferrin receptor protein